MCDDQVSLLIVPVRIDEVLDVGPMLVMALPVTDPDQFHVGILPQFERLGQRPRLSAPFHTDGVAAA
jgi:hypothetical protein